MKHLVTHARSPYRRLAGAFNGGMALFAILFASYTIPRQDTRPAPTPALRSGSAKAAREWYFRTGQWRADAMTLVAVAKWCFEANPAGTQGPTVGGIQGLPNTNSAAVSRI